ncbi:hypothetical protein FXV77_05280 [Sphingobacterium phlebotomi]|uniref:Uncharacterized protein n=1 Tax=Sphingobacterium phlebotomi TaxID=2605433 RepID=A0A5D4H9W7_9SPHI|nr:hypothetical protein [Sphingobacterium phlebotomi]TYR37417.1 hypothetical protein FXV77_05280 [Sphingobacterium phlebotomi]
MAVPIYYVVVILLYYRGDLKGILNKRAKATHEPLETEESDEENGIQDLEEMINKIKGSLEALGMPASKEDILEKLRQILVNYDGLRKPGFRVALTNFIIKQANVLCGVRFSEDDLEKEWKDLSR